MANPPILSNGPTALTSASPLYAPPALPGSSRHTLASLLPRLHNPAMPHEFSTSYIQDSLAIFRQYKKLAERAMDQCPDECLFVALDPESNCIAIIVKHMVGNMRSRWRNFLTTDGEKPDRNRDTEFEDAPKAREELR